MPARHRRPLWAIALIVACAGPSVLLAQQESSPPPASETSVVEAARKAKAAKATGRPRKVFTEDDLPGLKRNVISTVGTEAAPSSDAEAPGSPEVSLGDAPLPPPGERDEAYWRERAGKLRSEIEDLDQQITAVQEEIRKAGGAGFDPQSGLGVNVIYYTDRNNRLQRLQQRRDTLQKQMDTLSDEARRAGVPPGWLR